jgi:hypothetical protein
MDLLMLVLVFGDRENWERGPVSPTSLNIGGYDESTCNFTDIERSVHFEFSRKNNERDYFRIPDLTVHFSSSKQTRPLNYTLKDAVIDTSTPFIWLPEENIAEITDYYFSGDSLTKLADAANVLRFARYSNWWLSNSTFGISIPKPHPNSTLDLSIGMVEWFKVVNVGFRGYEVLPIRALPEGETSPVLGRPFFALACMLADYDRGLFAITNQNWNYNGAAKKVITERAFVASNARRAFSKKLTIVVSILVSVTILIILGAVYCIFRKRRRQKQTPNATPNLNEAKEETIPEPHREEIDGNANREEADGSSAHPSTASPNFLSAHTAVSQPPQPSHYYTPVELDAPHISELDDNPQSGRLKF